MASIVHDAILHITQLFGIKGTFYLFFCEKCREIYMQVDWPKDEKVQYYLHIAMNIMNVASWYIHEIQHFGYQPNIRIYPQGNKKLFIRERKCLYQYSIVLMDG